MNAVARVVLSIELMRCALMVPLPVFFSNDAPLSSQHHLHKVENLIINDDEKMWQCETDYRGEENKVILTVSVCIQLTSSK